MLKGNDSKVNEALHMFCTVRTLLLVDTEAQAENKICHRSAKNPFVVVVWKNYQMSMRMGNILFSLWM